MSHRGRCDFRPLRARLVWTRTVTSDSKKVTFPARRGCAQTNGPALLPRRASSRGRWTCVQPRAYSRTRPFDLADSLSDPGGCGSRSATQRHDGLGAIATRKERPKAIEAVARVEWRPHSRVGIGAARGTSSARLHTMPTGPTNPAKGEGRLPYCHVHKRARCFGNGSRG